MLRLTPAVPYMCDAEVQETVKKVAHNQRMADQTRPRPDACQRASRRVPRPCLLARLGVAAPQQEHEAAALPRQLLDGRIRKLLPALLRVRRRAVRPHRQHCARNGAVEGHWAPKQALIKAGQRRSMASTFARQERLASPRCQAMTSQNFCAAAAAHQR